MINLILKIKTIAVSESGEEIPMSHRSKIGITVMISVLVCLIGLVSSFAVSLRYGMRDRAIENLAEEWELSQMQITKIASYMSMAEFLAVMVQNPQITAEGTENVLDAEYTRDFVAKKLRDYRNDLLHDNGAGNVPFSEIVELFREYEETICQDLLYHIGDSDLETYEMFWDNLAITERTSLEYYRSDHRGLFALVRVILSGWFLAISVLLIAGAGVGIWFLHGRSFRGFGTYGVTLAVVGIADCTAAMLRSSMVSLINCTIDMRSNLMTLIFTPICNMLLITGVSFLILGILAIVCRVFLKSK